MSLFNRFFGKKPENQPAVPNAAHEPNHESEPMPEAIGSISIPTSPNQDQIKTEPSAAESETINTPWRTFSIFISSTFADMQAERDHLKNVVFPRVEEELQKRRIKLEIVDLRWGVDTTSMEQEDEREANVLKVCLDEIRRCRPFFIGLLGDRYGWVPPVERMKTALVGEPKIKPEKGKSVTDLEIEFGVLASQEQLVRSVFYFREPLPYETFSKKKAAMFSDEYNPELTDIEKAERKVAIENLKIKIRQHFKAIKQPNKVKSYPAVWDGEQQKVIGLKTWGDNVYKDILEECESHAKDTWDKVPQNWQEQEMALLNAFIEQHTHITTTVTDGKQEQVQTFCGRNELMKELIAHLLSNESGNWGKVLIGESGSGKSAVFAMVCKLMQERKDCFVLAHSAGLSPRAKNVADLLKIWNRQLAIFAGLEDDVSGEIDTDDLHSFQMPGQPDLPKATPIEKLQERFLELLQIGSSKKRVVLLIDALDRFEPTARAQYLSWLPTVMPQNVRLLCTAITGTEQKATQYHKGLIPKSIEIFSKEEAQEMLNALCKRNHKTLAEKVRQIILDKKRNDGELAFSSPLWLSLATNMLMALDHDDFEKISKLDGSGGEQIDAYLTRIASEFDPLPGSLFISLTQKAGAVFGDTFTKIVFDYLAICRNGLREKDLEKLLPANGIDWDPLQFANLRRWFKAHLVLQGKELQWNLAHSILRNTLSEKLSLTEYNKMHESISKHLLSLPKTDSMRISEMIYHLLESDNLLETAHYYGGYMADDEEFESTVVLAETIIGSEKGIGKAVQLPELQISQMEIFKCIFKRYIHNLNEALSFEGGLEIRLLLLNNLNELVENNISKITMDEHFGYDLGALYFNLGCINEELGKIETAFNHFKKIIVLYNGFSNDFPNYNSFRAGIAKALGRLGMLNETMGSTQVSEKYLKDSLDINIKLHNSNPNNLQIKFNLIESYHLLGGFYQRMGYLEKAQINLEKGIDLSYELYNSTPQNISNKRVLTYSFKNIAILFQRMKQRNKAEEYFSLYEKYSEELYKNQPNNEGLKIDLAVCYQLLGITYLENGHLDMAHGYLDKGCQYVNELLAANPLKESHKVQLANFYFQLGDLFTEKHNINKALDYYVKCEKIFGELHSLNQSNNSYAEGYAKSCDNFGHIALTKGNYRGAINYFEKGFEIITEVATLNSSFSVRNSLSISNQNLGSTYFALGDLNKALFHLEKGLEINKELYSSRPHESHKLGLSNSYMMLGIICKKLENYNEALSYFTEGSKITNELYNANPLDQSIKHELANSYSQLGQIHLNMGHMKESIDCFEKCLKLKEEIYEVNINGNNLSINIALLDEIGTAYYSLAILFKTLGDDQIGKWRFEQFKNISAFLAENQPNIQKYREWNLAQYDSNTKQSTNNSQHLSNSATYQSENRKINLDRTNIDELNPITKLILSGDFQKALQILIEEEAAIRRRPNNGWEFQANMGEQGNVLFKLGKYKDALQKYEIQAEVCARNRWIKIYATCLISQAEILLKHLNKPKQANTLLIEAIAIAEENKLDQIVQDAEGMLKDIK